MANRDESDDARVMVEAMSEVFNGLCQVVDPERLGQLSPSDVPPLRSSLRQLIELIPDFRGSTSPGLDLIAEVARELEMVLEGGITSPPNPRIRDLASSCPRTRKCGSNRRI